MTRDDITNEVLSLHVDNIVLQVATGVGKSLLALKLLDKWKSTKVLIVVPKNIFKSNWDDELKKWGFTSSKINVTYTTYISLHKYVGIHYDAIIFDEAHHVTENTVETFKHLKARHKIFLSATISRDKYKLINSMVHGIYNYTVPIKTAIDDNILPDPHVILIPLALNNRVYRNTYIRNSKASKYMSIKYDDYIWNRDKTTRVDIRCTDYQYIQILNKNIEYYKSSYMRTNNPGIKNVWLREASKRLKFLSEIKEPIIMQLQDFLFEYRTITFCNNIEQTERLCDYCINSKNPDAKKYYDEFNECKLNHISAVAMLDEGMNLNGCQMAIYANLSSSDRLIAQRLGRSLRHPDPYLVIPYYKDTREEEIVNKMLLLYNKSLVHSVSTITEFLNIIR